MSAPASTNISKILGVDLAAHSLGSAADGALVGLMPAARRKVREASFDTALLLTSRELLIEVYLSISGAWIRPTY